jgi:transposase
MNDPKPTAHQQALARRRAQLIMQVQSGLLSAQEAARQLQISRKTYYKWERRAPAAADRPGEGSTPTPEPGASGQAPSPGADGADPPVVGVAG